MQNKNDKTDAISDSAPAADVLINNNKEKKTKRVKNVEMSEYIVPAAVEEVSGTAGLVAQPLSAKFSINSSARDSISIDASESSRPPPEANENGYFPCRWGCGAIFLKKKNEYRHQSQGRGF